MSGAPDKIVVAGGGIWWVNDTWSLDGQANGRPRWCRNGNGVDKLAFVTDHRGSCWTISGTPGAGDSDVYICKSDSALPPETGWEAREGAETKI